MHEAYSWVSRIAFLASAQYWNKKLRPVIRGAIQDRELHCMNDYVTYVTVLKKNCILWLSARWISPNELYYMKRLLENFLNLTHWMIWENLCSYSHSKMLKCSLGLGNFCTNHLQSKHPNEMVTSVRGDLGVTVDVGDCHADSHQRYDIFPN